MPQFDPVAGAALGALDAAERGLNRFQSQANAPTLPAQSSVASTLRNGIQSLAQFSPFNLLAGGAPSGRGFPSPDQLGLPGLPQFGGSAFETSGSGMGGRSSSQGRSASRTTGGGSGESAFD